MSYRLADIEVERDPSLENYKVGYEIVGNSWFEGWVIVEHFTGAKSFPIERKNLIKVEDRTYGEVGLEYDY